MKLFYQQPYTILNTKDHCKKIFPSLLVLSILLIPRSVKAQAITTGTISGSPFCAGASGIIINFTYAPDSSFTGSTFTVQLSSATGSFAAPVNLQSIPSDGSDSQSITVAIPASTASGTNYKMRVVSSLPAVNGSPSASFTITANNWIGGTVSHLNDWNTASNWCNGAVPDVTTSVIIPNAVNYPIITATSYVNNITIASGASVTVDSGGTLSIHGSISNSGVFDATAGTIEMAGSSVQTISGSIFNTSTIYNLVDSNIEPTAGVNIGSTLNISNQLSFGYNNAILTTNNALVLLSNASATASVGQIAEDGSGNPLVTISGNVTVQRYYLDHRRWRFITAPVKSSGAPTISQAWQEGGQSIAGSVSDPNPGYGTHITGPTAGPFVSSTGYDQSSSNSASLARITGDLSWFSIPNTFVPVTSYQGMMLFVRGGRDFPIYTGTSFTPATAATLRTTGALNTGRVTIPVNTGFTVVGNPYAATINFNTIYGHAATTAAVTSNAFSMWDPNIGSIANIASGTGGWVTLSWNGTSYDPSPDPHLFDGFDVNGDIQSSGAFTVNGTGTGSVEIDESDKVTGTDGHLYLFRPADNTTVLSYPTTPIMLLRTTLFATDTAHVQTYLADGALNEFNASYSNDVDWSKDVQKLFNFAERVSILKDSQYLAIEKSAPPVAGDTVHLSVSGLKPLPYQFVLATTRFTRPDINAFFVDAFTHISTPIPLGDSSVAVNFTITADPASIASNRFFILFKAAPAGCVTYDKITAAAQQNKNIGVQWQVSNQVNTKEYVVERSTDKILFSTVDTTAATPTDTSGYVYNWTDTNVAFGTDYFYRVYIVGNNLATQDTSNLANAVMFQTAGINIAPNPVTNGTVNVQMSSKMPAGEYGIKIMGTSGDVFLTKMVTHGPTDETISIPFGKSVSRGMYILQMISSDKQTTKVNFEIQ
ncbi:MAG TPA: hypothetical protein VK718_05380 [Ferruginibacter sp.]|jgi:hypothetical protein|nr:hypothetical protein [Ferruginibacter sp.]